MLYEFFMRFQRNVALKFDAYGNAHIYYWFFSYFRFFSLHFTHRQISKKQTFIYRNVKDFWLGFEICSYKNSHSNDLLMQETREYVCTSGLSDRNVYQHNFNGIIFQIQEVHYFNQCSHSFSLAFVIHEIKLFRIRLNDGRRKNNLKYFIKL